MGSLRPLTRPSSPPDGPVSGEELDEQLVRRSRAGDDESFAALYRRYRGAVYAVCLRRLREPAAAEDVVQDTFLRAYVNLDRFDEGRRLLPWLTAIASRRCVDVHRRSAKTSTTDDIEIVWSRRDEPDPTLDAVMAGEERRRLERALRRLAPRQRRALLLYALEGWSYADIAEAEGISLTSTKSLLFHARENLRQACRRGVLGTILIPVAGVRRRLRELLDDMRVRLGTGAADPAIGAAGGSLGHGVAAIALSLAALTPQAAPLGSGAGVPSSTTAAPSTITAAPVGSAQRSFAAGAPVRGSQGARSLTRTLVDPTRGATPEETQFTSVAPSPNYDRDHTLVASGSVPCAQAKCPVLFVSKDAGASWERLNTQNFRGHTVLLPPGYPADKRMFAMGPSGLQASRDGVTFDQVLPVRGDVAISPLFERNDPRILIGATVVTEYWADKDLAKPATLIGPAGTWLTVAFSPAYASDGTVFVGGIRPDTTGVMRPTVNRCAGSVCEGVVFADGFDAPWVRPSPTFGRDSTVHAFTAHFLYRSIDGGRTYITRAPSFAAESSVRDLAIARGGTLFAALQSAAKGTPNGVYRSFDGGKAWTGAALHLPGFELGVARIITAGGGRIIALGATHGIACSTDEGRSWTVRCSG